MNKIIKLPPDTARKIAAGEVIERPQSVVRELLDNAIDADANRITVSIKQGGLEFIQVSDNGTGIYKEDLEVAIEPHATSKIAHIDDLLHLHTLGFRGEALASIAAVAELEIISAVEHGKGARLFSMPSLPVYIESYGAPQGTVVTVRNLFANFPARKKFLKYPHAEALACRQTFLEKAMPFPSIEFIFDNDTSKLLLGRETLINRVKRIVFEDLPLESITEIPLLGENFSGSIITASPSFSRKDRRLLQVFVNNRKIQEFSLLQAVEYAFRDQLPGGVFPCAIIFLAIDPSLVDFNVHPAKKEARIKNITQIRTGIINAVKQYLRTTINLSADQFSKPTAEESNRLFSLSNTVGRPSAYSSCSEKHKNNYSSETQTVNLYKTSAQPDFSGLAKNDRSADFTELRLLIQNNKHINQNQHIEHFRVTLENTQTDISNHLQDAGTMQDRDIDVKENSDVIIAYRDDSFIYHGQFLLMFLIFELGSDLYILDQHAAHERIIFDKLCASNNTVQELLIPFTYTTKSEEEDLLLTSIKDKLKAINIILEKDGNVWQITGVPTFLSDKVLGNIFELLLEHNDADAVIKHTLASIACKAAVKEGEALDEISARALIREALALPDPHCPHGRPIWIQLSEKELLSRIGRTI